MNASWEVLAVDLPDLPAALEVSRPEVLLVSTPPDAEAQVEGYRLVLSNGVQQVLLRHDVLGSPEVDGFTSPRERQLAEEVETWRACALSAWEEQAAAGPASGGLTDLLAMRQSVSWRVTRPLRSVRSRLPGA